MFTETQLSARFLHFVIIFCQKMAVFPHNAREAQLSACHLKRSMCHWGRRILAHFCLFMEHTVLRYKSFVHWPVYRTCCVSLRILCAMAFLWSMLCSDTGFMRKSLLSFLKLIFLYYHYIFHQIVILEVGFRLFPLLLCNLAFYNFV